MNISIRTVFPILALLLFLTSECHSFATQSQIRAQKRQRWLQVRKDDESDDDLDDVSEHQSRRLFLGSIIAGLAVMKSEPEPALAISTKPTGSSSQIQTTSLLTTSNAAPATTTTVDWNAILKKSSKRALGGGKAGATAAVVQVCTLMWLRTSMNYQYRYGGNLQSSLSTLWEEGGVARLYQGLPFALVQGPLTRFGDTAANVGILALLESFDETRDLPVPLKTAFGSVTAGLWRIFLMPIDASKTAMQVEGKEGLQQLWSTVVKNEDGTGGPGALYRGALAQAAATAAGHFPWFATYNYLDANLPLVTDQSEFLLTLARSAALGLGASCVSDCVSNSLRVIKTTKQTAQLGTSPEGESAQKELSYPEIVSMIVEKDGVAGLLGRGLQTRLLTNAIQGAVFSVLWKYFQQA